MEAPPSALVRPALELAWALARAGERQRPPVAAPGPLRPLTQFARLPERALDAVRQAVDEDAEFRRRVAAAADERTVGRPGWLWLARPDGWEREMAEAAAAAAARADLEDDQREERAARRRLVAVEAALRRAEEERASLVAAGQALAAELAELRQARRAEQDAAGRDRSAALAADQAAAAAVAGRDEAAARAASAQAARRAAEERLAASESERVRLAGDLDRAGAELSALRASAAASDVARHGVEDRVAAAVAAAAAAAADLGRALAGAAAALGAGPEAGDDDPSGEGGTPVVTRAPVAATDGGGTPGGEGRAGPARERSRARARRHRRADPPTAPAGVRRPLALPGAVFDDSPEAAAWLLRVPGVVVVVDGYNVTLSTWPDAELGEQRHRLVHALGEVAMRTGAHVEVVFDGDEAHAWPLPSGTARRVVRVAFSPPGVDADEVIIDRVAALPAGRPVVVATDDRRVRAEVEARGANLLSSAQLVGLLRRHPGPPGRA